MRVVASDGRFRLEQLEPGNYELIAETASGYAFRTARLTPNESRELLNSTSALGRPCAEVVVNGRREPLRDVR